MDELLNKNRSRILVMRRKLMQKPDPLRGGIFGVYKAAASYPVSTGISPSLIGSFALQATCISSSYPLNSDYISDRKYLWLSRMTQRGKWDKKKRFWKKIYEEFCVVTGKFTFNQNDLHLQKRNNSFLVIALSQSTQVEKQLGVKMAQEGQA